MVSIKVKGEWVNIKNSGVGGRGESSINNCTLFTVLSFEFCDCFFECSGFTVRLVWIEGIMQAAGL